MPCPTIDYMNARRECRAASGGTTYQHKRNAADDRAQWVDLDQYEQEMIQIRTRFESAFADARAEFLFAKSTDDLEF